MQDPRFRIGSAALLSAAAFVSIAGAVAVLIWWVAFTPRLAQVRNRKGIALMLALLGAISALVQLTGGNGISYFVRMAAILAIGIWLYASWECGDFLSVCVWFGGERAGFDLGLVAEMAMHMARSLEEDAGRIRMAYRLKGITLSAGQLVPSGMLLIRDALSRADDCSELLAVRGYRGGGTFRPSFCTARSDYAAAFLTACCLVVAVLPLAGVVFA